MLKAVKSRERLFPFNSFTFTPVVMSRTVTSADCALTLLETKAVNIKNAASYLESDLITAVGGSWVAKRDLILAENWDQITANAKEIIELVKQVRSKK